MVPGSLAQQSAVERLLFQPLEQKSIGLRPLLWGSILSLLVCGGVLFALEHGAGRMRHLNSLFMPDPQQIQGTRKPTPHVTLSCQSSGARTTRVTVVVSAGEDNPTPTGAVNFLNGWRQFKKEPLVDGSASIRANVSDKERLPIRAIYLGDDNYGSSNSAEFEDEERQDSCNRLK